MSTEKKITDTYFHGAAIMVAAKVKVSDRYVRDVLNGVYDEGKFTPKRLATIKKIKKAAEPFKKPQAEN